MLTFKPDDMFPGVISITGKRFADDRGFFCESFRQSEFEEQGFRPFVQENHSFSKANTFRGLHYQLKPRSQGKLVYCVAGEIWDYVVDIRKKSPTYGRWKQFYLTSGMSQLDMIYVPPGFAHGFYVSGMEPAHVIYKVTDYYSPGHERSIRWNDPDLNISYRSTRPIMSDKDINAPLLKDAENNFVYGEGND
jgi:dTDP-4-dehydrorhamnose 3,5-epimerase